MEDFVMNELERISYMIENTSNYILELIRNNEKRSRLCETYAMLKQLDEMFYKACNEYSHSNEADSYTIAFLLHMVNDNVSRATQATLKYMDK
jgi:hypothetical protein